MASVEEACSLDDDGDDEDNNGGTNRKNPASQPTRVNAKQHQTIR